MQPTFYPLPLPSRRGVVLVFCYVAVLSLSALAADRWTDISSPLLERLTNNAAKPAWPGGCAGVVVNRTNGDVTIKVVGLVNGSYSLSLGQ